MASERATIAEFLHDHTSKAGLGEPASPSRQERGSTRTIGLNFHGIGRPARPLELGEERFWISPDAFRSVLDAVVAANHSGDVKIAITFDDGNISDREIAAPALAERGLRATYFPLAGRLGEPYALSPADLRALRAEGHAIGSHGFDHRDWCKLDRDGTRREFRSARDAIAAAAAGPVEAIAVPFGRYSRRVLQALRSEGYASAHTSDGGCYRGTPWIRPRTCIRHGMDPEGLASLLAGRSSALRRVRRALGIARKRLL
jgi:peptidoglycan/xylan/chitin deacetylase (PgdA/CDA1 family)